MEKLEEASREARRSSWAESKAIIMVEEEEGCVAYSGSLYSTQAISCLENGVTVITAQENEAAVIPKGYQQLFVLTNAFTLTILDVSNTPSFEINRRGFYRIHSLVYNPATLDLSIVVPGIKNIHTTPGLNHIINYIH